LTGKRRILIKRTVSNQRKAGIVRRIYRALHVGEPVAADFYFPAARIAVVGAMFIGCFFGLS